jgi:hypothetical protein
MANSFLLLLMLLPAPARFSLQFPLFLLCNLLVISGTLFNRLMLHFHQEKVHNYGTVFFLFFATILFKQLLVLYSPVLALVLAVPLYPVLFCAMEVGGLLDIEEFAVTPLKDLVAAKARKSLQFSGAALGIALVRELLAFHAISVPSPAGMVELVFSPTPGHPFSIFWASIPGCLVLAALLGAASSFILHNKEADRA